MNVEEKMAEYHSAVTKLNDAEFSVIAEAFKASFESRLRNAEETSLGIIAEQAGQIIVLKGLYEDSTKKASEYQRLVEMLDRQLATAVEANTPMPKGNVVLRNAVCCFLLICAALMGVWVGVTYHMVLKGWI